MTRLLASGRLALAFAAMLVCGAVPAKAAADLLGAIAFSQATGAEGYALDYAHRRRAETRAIAECNKFGGGCRIATWFRNACGALAVGRGNGYGSTWAPSRYAAEQASLKICGKHTGGCAIRRWVCTSHEN